MFREKNERFDDLTLEFDAVEVVLVHGRRVEEGGTKDKGEITGRHSICSLMFRHSTQKLYQEL